MQEPPNPPGSAPELPSFDEPLEGEDQILDHMLVRLSKGALDPDAWDQLHRAAVRDNRVSELAFAYEGAAQGRRVKTLPVAAAAEFYFQAGNFFADSLGDDLGARSHLERALSVQPGHRPAFDRLFALLEGIGDHLRLAELCTQAAGHRQKDDQADLLKRAAQIYAQLDIEEERATELFAHVLRLRPSDDDARRALEERYSRAGRFKDVTRLLEQGLAQDPPPEGNEALMMRARLLQLYAFDLGEPERAIGHIEVLLQHNPSREDALRTAESLLENKALVARAAGALAQAYDAVGNIPETNRMLSIELEATRGPKRKEVLKRIGILRQGRLGDLRGAYDAFEAALGVDPSDDEVRARYATLALDLGVPLDAAKTLSRVSSLAKDAATRARVASEMADLMRQGGDVKRARATFVSVFGMPNGDAVAVLRSARALIDIYAQEKDLRGLADALERVGQLATDEVEQREANERLAVLAQGPLGDVPRAASAWRRLLGTPLRAQALDALVPIYEQSGDSVQLAFVLEEQSKDYVDEPAFGRALMFRAADLLSNNGSQEEAADAWDRLVATFGDSPDVAQRRLPLLERLERWDQLAEALESAAKTSNGEERAPVYARLGNLHAKARGDINAAIEAYRRALVYDPQEPTARTALESLLDEGEHRLEAAQVLEPIYRLDARRIERSRLSGSLMPPAIDGSGAHGALLHVLSIRAELSPVVSDRLSALDEAVRVAEEAAPGRALSFAGQGLGEALSAGEDITNWLAALERARGKARDPSEVATVVDTALTGQPIASAALFQLAVLGAKGYTEAGNVPAALSLYRRALSFDETSEEILGNIDDLLSQAGSVDERIALHQSTLERLRDDEPRKVALLHTVAKIRRFEADDVPGAIAAYARALALAPSDRPARAALTELYEETSDWGALRDLLQSSLMLAADNERTDLHRRLARLGLAQNDLELGVEHAAALLIRDDTDSEGLEIALRVGQAAGDARLTEDALELRATRASAPAERVLWLGRYADFLSQRGAVEPAVERWKEAALAAQGSGDDETGRAMLERVLDAAPKDHGALSLLVALDERTERWQELPSLLARLADVSAPSDRVALFMQIAELEERRLGRPDAAFEAAKTAFQLAPERDDALQILERIAREGRREAEFAEVLEEQSGHVPARRPFLRAAVARLYGSFAEHVDRAAETYRSLLSDPEADADLTRIALGDFEALLADHPDRTDDARWLFALQLERAEGDGRSKLLLDWAEIEETRFDDKAAALALYERAKSESPDDTTPREAMVRLLLEAGNGDAAVAALEELRDLSTGDDKLRWEHARAVVLIERCARPEEALDSAERIYDDAPGDARALELALRLITVPELAARASGLLSKALEDATDTSSRIAALQTLLSRATSAPRDMRRDWHTQLADQLEEAGDTQGAFDAVLLGAEELGDDMDVWDRAEGLARATNAPDAVAATYARVLAVQTDGALAAALGERAVSFHEEWFDDESKLVSILERVLELDASQGWAFDRLKLVYDAASRWEELFKLFDRALAVTKSVQERATLLEEVAQIAKDFANESSRAISYLKQLLELKPDNARLAASLERLYERAGRHAELAQLLLSQMGGLGAKEAQEQRSRVAMLRLEAMGDFAGALSMIEEIIAHETLAAGAQVDVCALTEKVLAAAPVQAEMPSATSLDAARRDSVPPASLPKHQLVRQRAAQILRERYAGAGHEADLARVLEVELEAIRNVKDRIRRHDQLAGLYEGLERVEAAVEHVVQLVSLEPEVTDHRSRLLNLVRRIGRFDRFVSVLLSAADDQSEPGLRAALLLEAGRVCALDLGDAAQAVEILNTVFRAHPEDPQVEFATCKLLEPLLRDASAGKDLLDVLERLAALDPEPQSRAEHLTQTGRLATKLGETKRGIAAWEARLALVPTDAEAVDGLVAMFDETADWARLAKMLDLRAGFPRSDEDKRADLVRIAHLSATELGQADEAILRWQIIEEQFGESDEITVELERLLLASGDARALRDVYKSAAARSEGEARSTYFQKLGALEQDKLGETKDALKSYEASLAADPANEGARLGLERMLVDAALRRDATFVLLDAYQRKREWRKLIELLPHRLDAAQDDAGRIDVLVETARLAEEEEGDPRGAFRLQRRAFLLMPTRADLEASATRLAEATSEWQALSDAMREALTGTMPDNVREAMSLRLAAILEERLGEPRAALTLYQGAAAGGDLKARLLVVRTAGHIGQWDVVASILIDGVASGQPEVAEAALQAASASQAWDELALATTGLMDDRGPRLAPEIARDLEAMVAVWHRDRRGDPDAAEVAYTRALRYDRESPTLLAELTQLQRRGKGRPLVESLQRLSQATGGDLDLLAEAAEVALNSVFDRALARTILERMLRIATERWTGGEDAGVSAGSPIEASEYASRALMELVRIHRDEGNHARVAELLVEGAKLPFPAEKQRDLLFEAATIRQTALGDDAAAIALLTELLGRDPADTEVSLALTRLYEGSGRTEELLALKHQLVGHEGDLDRRITLRIDAARLSLTLERSDQAEHTLQENLAERPGDPRTLAALKEAFEHQGRIRDYETIVAREAQINESKDRARGVELWLEAAAVAERDGAGTARVKSHLEKAIALDRSRASALDWLARVCEGSSDTEGAIRSLEGLIGLSSPEERVAVALRLVDALLRIADTARARDRLETELLLEPKAHAIRHKLASLYREQKQWVLLAELLGEGAGHAATPDAELALLKEAAELWRGECNDAAQAIPLLERATSMAPDDRALKVALADALGGAHREAEARQMLKELIDGFGGRRPKERAVVHLQIAKLDLREGARAPALLELETATRIDPTNADILLLAGALAREDNQLDRAERSYRALLTVLRRQEEAERISRAEVLANLADIAARQGQADRANEILESAFEAAQESDREAERLQETLLERGDQKNAARVLEARLARSEAGRSRAHLLSLLAGAHAAVGRTDEALSTWLRALEEAPLSLDIRRGARAFTRTSAKPQDYLSTLERVLASDKLADAGIPAQVTLLTDIAETQEQDLRNLEAAAAAYERIYEIAPSAAQEHLERIYEAVQDYRGLDHTLRRRMEQGSGDDQVLERMLEIELQQTKDPIAAQKTLEDLLASKGPSEAMLEQARACADAFPSHLGILDVYDRIVREPGRERELTMVLMRKWADAQAGSDPAQEAMQIALTLDAPTHAEALMRRFLDRPTDEGSVRAWVLVQLAALRRAAADFPEAVLLLREAAELSQAREARDLLFEVATLAKDELRDMTLAMTTLEDLYERDADDSEVWAPLLDAYRHFAENEKFATLVERILPMASDEDRKRLRFEAIEVRMNRLGLGDDAAPMIEELLEDDPSNVEAALLLSGIYERQGKNDALAGLLAKQLDTAKDRGDAGEIAKLSLRLGGLLEAERRDEAKSVYYAALDWDATSVPLLKALAGLHALGGADEAQDRAEILDRLLPLLGSEHVESYALELSVLRADLWDMEGAVAALEFGFRQNPASEALRERLESLYREGGHARKLAEMYETRVAVVPPDDAVRLLRDAANIYAAELDEQSLAAAALRKAHQIRPQQRDITDTLLAALEAAGEFQDARELMGELIEQLPADAEERGALLDRRGSFAARVGDDEGAMSDWEQAVAAGSTSTTPTLVAHLEDMSGRARSAGDTAGARALRLRACALMPSIGMSDRARDVLTELLREDSRDRHVLRLLAEIEESKELWDAALAIYKRLTSLEEGTEVAVCALKLFEMCERAGRMQDAKTGLERARAAVPGHAEVRAKLEQVYELTGATKELGELLISDAVNVPDVAAKCELLMRGAVVLINGGHEPEMAVAALEEAHTLKPSDLDCVAMLADAYNVSGQVERAQEVLQTTIATFKGRRAKELSALYHRLARVAEALGDKPGELAHLVSALDMDAQNGVVASELSYLAMELGSWDVATRALRTITMLKTAAPLPRAQAYHHLAEISVQQGDAKKGIMLLRRALDEDPSLDAARALLSELEGK
jgi:tetratricopeptide (TPR) repeat protein